MPPSKRGRYLGFVAHEIKNPLATALWSCDLLKRMDAAERGSERGEKMIDVSLRALRRMRRLIDDYFTIERLLENGYELKSERLPLRDLVDAALQGLSEKDGLETTGWSVDVSPVEVQGDGDMLRRGLRAALEHMARASRNPRLSISSGAGPRAALQIRAENPPSPVVPPDPEERPAGDPTGSILGFALASRIFAAHGGSVSERDGALLLSL